MKLRAPLPIEHTERNIPNAMGIEPGDLTPCLVQPEIWVRGHAWHPPAEGAPSVRVRLAVARGAELIMRKSVEIPIQQNPFVPPFLHAFAPRSCKWPVRTRLLGAFDWANLNRSPIELPDVFDWTFFQTAPEDQRLGLLRGDEWIRLESIHSTIHKFDTQLPSATCAIMMFGSVDPFRQGTTVRSGLDTIQIDADRGTCSLIFRGHIPLSANIALEDLHFVAGLGLPDRPIPKLEKQTPPAANETFALDPTILQRFLEEEALPFQEGPSAMVAAPAACERRPSKADAGLTFAPDEDFLRALAQQQALPFQNGSVNAKPPLPKGDPIVAIAAPLTRKPDVAGSPVAPTAAEQIATTFLLSEELLAQLATSPTTPFAGAEPLPERDEPLDTLAGLPFQPGLAKEHISGSLGACFLAAMEEARRAGERDIEHAAQ